MIPKVRLALLFTRLWNFSLESIYSVNYQVMHIIQEFKHNFVQFILMITVNSCIANVQHFAFSSIERQSQPSLDHCARISISHCSCRQLSGDRIIWYSLVSSANKKRRLKTNLKDNNSFTYRANSRGPRTDP